MTSGVQMEATLLQIIQYSTTFHIKGMFCITASLTQVTNHVLVHFHSVRRGNLIGLLRVIEF